MSPKTSVSPAVVDASAVLQPDHEANRLAQVQRSLAGRRPVAGRVVGVDHRHLQLPASTVPPLFMPMISTPRRPARLEPQRQLVDAQPRRLGARARSSARRHLRPRAAREPEVVEMAVDTSITSHCSTSPTPSWATLGLPNHGSNRTTLPPGVRSSTHEWPYQVKVRHVGHRRTSCADALAECLASGAPRFRLQYRILALIDPLIRGLWRRRGIGNIVELTRAAPQRPRATGLDWSACCTPATDATWAIPTATVGWTRDLEAAGGGSYRCHDGVELDSGRRRLAKRPRARAGHPRHGPASVSGQHGLPAGPAATSARWASTSD